MNFANLVFPQRTLKIRPAGLPRKLGLLDVGARGGIQWPFDRIGRDLLSVVMVEPDPVEAALLKQSFEATGDTVLESALWREEQVLSLNITRSPGASSVFKPDRKFLNQFPESKRFDILQTPEIAAKTIDGLLSTNKLPSIDFIKIDAQGSELAILEGGRKFLKSNLVALEVEISFAAQYTGQALFADVEPFVRTQLGLELWDLRKTYWKYQSGQTASGPIKGRLIFGDALFLRPLESLGTWLGNMPGGAAQEKATMLVLVTLLYGFIDYANALLATPFVAGYLGVQQAEVLNQLVRSAGSGLRPLQNGSGALFALFDGLSRLFQPTHGGWASVGQRLGSRRRGPLWL